MVGPVVAVGLAAVLLAGCGSAATDIEVSAPRTSTAASPAVPPDGPGDRTEPSQSGAGGAGAAGLGAAGPDGTDPEGPDPHTVGPDAQASPGASRPALNNNDPAVPGDASGGSPAAGPANRSFPVFVGQPCVPQRDTAARQAINGLALYCERTDAGQPRWGLASPPPPDPAAPAPSAECAVTDTGRVVQGANGRPVVCLRDPDGNLRWSDVS
ncbi:hypothetical protein [Protofrankia symbiont of Coriaria ruscifolia]|uniref:hypothetical protein n=1 Tax=Protofrankia symbiont of Coriaria ruscifolia TaxID=1306542 RepID=UPI001041461D|nr:hypothetical protein [Protofrankia symbiont of Coriaria ruscifolia]